MREIDFLQLIFNDKNVYCGKRLYRCVKRKIFTAVKFVFVVEFLRNIFTGFEN